MERYSQHKTTNTKESDGSYQINKSQEIKAISLWQPWASLIPY
jgi:hypothetical protein